MVLRRSSIYLNRRRRSTATADSSSNTRSTCAATKFRRFAVPKVSCVHWDGEDRSRSQPVNSERHVVTTNACVTMLARMLRDFKKAMP
jgi:hypothetical protein